MVMTESRLKLSRAKIKEFNKIRDNTNRFAYKSNYGTHFYNYFKLDSITDQSQVSKLKNTNQETAEKLIKEIFVITK